MRVANLPKVGPMMLATDSGRTRSANDVLSWTARGSRRRAGRRRWEARGSRGRAGRRRWEAELTAAGFDVAAERAKANAFLEALESGESTATPTSSPTLTPAPTSTPAPSSTATLTSLPTRRPAKQKPRARPRVLVPWLVAAVTSAAAGVSLYANFQESPVAHPLVVPSANDLVVAADLRRKAAAACDAQQWSVCLAELDKARDVDPGGDDATRVKSLRDKAVAAILELPPAPSPRK